MTTRIGSGTCRRPAALHERRDDQRGARQRCARLITHDAFDDPALVIRRYDRPLVHRPGDVFDAVGAGEVQRHRLGPAAVLERRETAGVPREIQDRYPDRRLPQIAIPRPGEPAPEPGGTVLGSGHHRHRLGTISRRRRGRRDEASRRLKPPGRVDRGHGVGGRSHWHLCDESGRGGETCREQRERGTM